MCSGVERSARNSVSKGVGFVRRLGKAGLSGGQGPVGRLDVLARAGLPMPEGFVVTVAAHREFIRSCGLAGTLCGDVGRGERSRRRAGAVRRAYASQPLGGGLVRAIREPLLGLGARTVLVRSEGGVRRGLGTIPAVISAIRRAWLATDVLEKQLEAAIGGEELPTYPLLVQRETYPEYTGYSTTAEVSHSEPGAALYEVEPVEAENIASLTRQAAAALGTPARLIWGLEGGRWWLISVESEGV